MKKDIIAVGFGPSNIGLAVAFESKNAAPNIAYLEKESSFGWQEQMLFQGTDIQHNPLRDFITPIDPTSRFGYLSYLMEKNRLFHFLNLPHHHIPRCDYSEYVTWVAKQFDSQVFKDTKIRKIEVQPLENGNGYARLISETGQEFYCKDLILGPGRSPNIPRVFEGVLGDNVVHFTECRNRLDTILSEKTSAKIVVIGASQSAAELILYLVNNPNVSQIYSVFRSYSYILKDTSPFTDELLFPEEAEYFFSCDEDSKTQLRYQQRRSNYGSMDRDMIDTLYFYLYEQVVKGEDKLRLIRNTKVQSVSQLADGTVRLALIDVHNRSETQVDTDLVILATGFVNTGGLSNDSTASSTLLNSLAQFYRTTSERKYIVTRDYRLVPNDGLTGKLPRIYLNGICEDTHGLSDAGSFSHIALRADKITNSILGR